MTVLWILTLKPSSLGADTVLLGRYVSLKSLRFVGRTTDVNHLSWSSVEILTALNRCTSNLQNASVLPSRVLMVLLQSDAQQNKYDVWRE